MGPTIIHGYVISQSNVESCLRTTSGLTCSLFLLINSVVTTGSNGTESILVSSIVDRAGVVRNLSNPISVNVTKGPVYVRYSLVYVSDVNSKPREVVSTTSLLGCVSDTTQLASNPSCGYLYFRGSPIRYSEGFCCKCSLDQLFGLGSHQRGGVQCNLLTSLFANGASVHCLRWGPVWYSLFRIMTPTIESTVVVSVGDQSPTRLVLTSQLPAATATSVNDSLNVTARLVGSFAWTRPPTDWGLQMYAASPNVAASTSASALADFRVKNSSPTDPFRYGMLVPISSVDLSGDTCNKIGVSFSGFSNNQGDKCSAYVGDCLQNQLDDYWSALTGGTAMKPGVNTCINVSTSLCSSIGGQFVPNDGYRLSCVLSDSSADSPTQVLIQLNAKTVSLVRNEALGSILNVAVSSDTKALSQTAKVEVLVQNIGYLQAEYLVSVRECQPDGLLLPLAGADISIAPNASSSVSLKIEDSNNTGNVYTCYACMSDTSGLELSRLKFELNTTSLISTRGGQSTDNSTGTAGNAGGVASDGVTGTDSCSTSCTGFFDVLCFISRACWTKLAALLGTVGGIGTFIGLMTKFGGWAFMWHFLKSICCCGPQKKSKRRMSDSSHPEQVHGFHQQSARDIYQTYVPPQPFNPYWVPNYERNQSDL